MSYRNPYTTSFLYKTTEEERDAIRQSLERQFGLPVHFHNGYISGLHSASHPGALAMEELEYLTDALVKAGITTPFHIAFAGEQPEDRFVFTYDPQNWHPASHR